MDLAVYISELLGLHGEVNVPGVGYFAQIRVDGYYNEQEKKFYPPSHKINFDPKLSEDEGLARYISEKKNISMLSSRYFIDKYVGGIKQQVISQNVEIDGLGYLCTENSGIVFKPAGAVRENDPSFFGFVPLKVHKNSEQSARVQPERVERVREVEMPLQEEITAKEDPAGAVVSETAAQEIETSKEPEYIVDEYGPTRSSKIWIVVLLIAGIIALSLVAVYQYFPTIFDNFKNNQQKPIVQPAAVKPEVKPAVKTDSVAKTAVKPDTAAKAAAQPVNKTPVAAPQQTVSTTPDSSKRVHYEILGGAFNKLSEAENTVNNYKKMGFDARVLEDVPGKLHKITLGTYYTQADAVAAESKILSTKKINKKTIYIQYYKPKK